MSFANLFLDANIFALTSKRFNKKKSGHVAVTLADAVPFVFVCCDDVDAQNEGERKIPFEFLAPFVDFSSRLNEFFPTAGGLLHAFGFSPSFHR